MNDHYKWFISQEVVPLLAVGNVYSKGLFSPALPIYNPKITVVYLLSLLLGVICLAFLSDIKNPFLQRKKEQRQTGQSRKIDVHI